MPIIHLPGRSSTYTPLPWQPKSPPHQSARNMVFHGLGDTEALGDVFSDGATIVAAVLTDPALPDAIAVGLELMSFEQGPSGANPGGGGMGLSKLVPLLKAYVWYRENPFGTFAIAVGAFLIPILAGVVIGKSTK